jgi:hypothetical protein
LHHYFAFYRTPTSSGWPCLAFVDLSAYRTKSAKRLWSGNRDKVTITVFNSERLIKAIGNGLRLWLLAEEHGQAFINRFRLQAHNGGQLFVSCE